MFTTRMFHPFLKLTLISALALNLGCGGMGPAKSEMSQAVRSLEAARKTNCAHDSLSLAEATYQESKRLFDEGDYDQARAKARVADQLAKEALKASGGKPCELPTQEVATKSESELFPPEINPPAEVETKEVEEMQVVYFAFDSSSLSPETLVQLDKNLEWINANPSEVVILEGHCDARGTEAYNLALSERRALSVQGYLLKSGVPADNLDVVPFGSQYPASTRLDSEGHRLNRRVEFKVK